MDVPQLGFEGPAPGAGASYGLEEVRSYSVASVASIIQVWSFVADLPLLAGPSQLVRKDPQFSIGRVQVRVIPEGQTQAATRLSTTS